MLFCDKKIQNIKYKNLYHFKHTDSINVHRPHLKHPIDHSLSGITGKLFIIIVNESKLKFMMFKFI